jgi:hypothetical protein
LAEARGLRQSPISLSFIFKLDKCFFETDFVAIERDDTGWIMKFGTIGAGTVALAFAREALATGHEVVLSSRHGRLEGLLAA